MTNPNGGWGALADLENIMKLFVWTEVLTDYTDGIIFALAYSVAEAREVIIRDKEDWIDVSEIFEKEPEIVTSPKGFALYGGS